MAECRWVSSWIEPLVPWALVAASVGEIDGAPIPPRPPK